MSKFSKKGWDSDFRASNFTGDQLERYMDGLRDGLHGRSDPIVRSGKTIHPHKLFGETAREFTSDEIFATMLAAAKAGDFQRQYLVGLEFAKRGDLVNARIWLKKAADKNWPGAKETLAEIAGNSSAVSQEAHPSSCDNRAPRVMRYKVFSIPFNPGKFFASVRVDGCQHWYHMGLVAASYGIDLPMMYDTYETAELDAKKILLISSKRGASVRP